MEWGLVSTHFYFIPSAYPSLPFISIIGFRSILFELLVAQKLIKYFLPLLGELTWHCLAYFDFMTKSKFSVN